MPTPNDAVVEIASLLGHEKGIKSIMKTRSATSGRGSRRDLFRGGAAFLVTASVAGCDLFDTDPAGEQRPTDRSDTGARESPTLAKAVAAGDLPPLDERLPVTPLVVQPIDRTSVYGGTWNDVVSGPAELGHVYRNIGYDQMLGWDRDYATIVPNIVESFDVAAGGREHIVTLRAGMKWSDGEPFTVDDLIFTYRDVLLNTDLFPVPPAPLQVAGEPVTVEPVDDRTVKFVSAVPHGLFAMYIAGPLGQPLLPRPRHYLEQFHAGFDQDIGELVSAEGYDDWPALFQAKSSRWENVELPTLNAWVITVPPGEGTQIVAERNPYYWKTDPDGRQLPYLDKVVFDVIEDEEVQVLRASQGQINMSVAWFNNPANKPVLARSRKEGGYRFFEARSDFGNQMIISLNLAHQDQQKRELFQNKDVRIGLSLAINREEVIQTAFQSQGVPWQAAPREESPFYIEEFGTQYTEHDPTEAQRRLDAAGYSERDDDGFRLFPDGSRITFDVDAIAGVRQYWLDALELIKVHWEEVGIDMRLNTIDRSLFTERREANQHDANVWNDAGTLLSSLVNPLFWFPFSAGSNFAIPWAKWYNSGGSGGERPPEAPRRQMELYDQLKQSVDSDEQQALFMDILRIAQEEFYVIGIVKPAPGYGIVAEDFQNVPKSLLHSWLYVSPGPTRPEQYYIAE